MSDESKKDPEFDKIERKPILLNSHTVMLIQLFHAKDTLVDSWMWDWIDAQEEQESAAEQFIAQLEGNESGAFLMALRRVITKSLEQHDMKYGTNWAKE